MSILDIAKTDIDSLIGETLKPLVLESGQSMSEIANGCIIKESRLRKLLSGKVRLSITELVNLSRILDFSIPNFFLDLENKVDGYMATGVAVDFVTKRK